MPGLGNKRRAIQEGRDWTKEGIGYMGGGHVTGYKGGGKVTGYKGGGKFSGGVGSYKKKDRRP